MSLQRLAVTGFAGSYQQRTDQDRFPTATTGRSVERADIAANDFHVRGFAEKLVGKSRVEFGVDINGRFGLNAIDDLDPVRPGGRHHQYAAQRVDRHRAPRR